MAEIREMSAVTEASIGEGVEECWMDFDGARMRYLRAGSGPPLVLLHGLMAYSFSWRFVLPALAPYATLYAPDLLGAGFSDRPGGIDHSMQGTALRVTRFVKIWAWRRSICWERREAVRLPWLRQQTV